MGENERREEIVGAVDGVVSTLVGLFEREPTRFFTENDLVCYFHRMLHEALAGLGLATVPDKDGKPHNLIHCEYPTPFRCDMGGKRFEIKRDDARTPGGKKYRRGRFDVAVLNPSFISKHSYATVKAQHYDTFRSAVLAEPSVDVPVAIYGVEFVFCRDEIKPSRGRDWEKAAREFVAKVQQDTAKLQAGVAVTGFMTKGAMLAFVKGTTGKVMDAVSRSLSALPCVRLTTAP
jgi:hypothetical protein